MNIHGMLTGIKNVSLANTQHVDMRSKGPRARELELATTHAQRFVGVAETGVLCKALVTPGRWLPCELGVGHGLARLRSCASSRHASEGARVELL